MEKTINKPEGETGRLIDTQFWSFNQTKKKRKKSSLYHFCALCTFVFMKLRSIVPITCTVRARRCHNCCATRVNLCKNQGVKTSLYRLVFILLYYCCFYESTCVTTASARKRTRQQHDSWHDGRKVDIKRMKFDFSPWWPWAAAAFTESVWDLPSL